MDEKKSISISVTGLFLFLAIIVIIAMGYYIYIQNTKYHTDIANLEKTIINAQSTVTTTQKNTTTPSVNAPETTTVSFTDAEVKTALTDYLALRTNNLDDGVLEYLTEKGKLNYDSSKNTIKDDGTVITTIKFSDYKSAMLNYVSEDEFERNWSTSIYFSENSNGFVTTLQGGGGAAYYNINKITKINDTTYHAETTVTYEAFDGEDEYNFIFLVTSYNGKCVIDHI